MKIDLHVHTSERSHCGRSPQERIAAAALRYGLDAIVLSDHDRLAPPQDLMDLNEKFAPLKIFGGIEVTVENEHVVVIGVRDPRLETAELTYPELHALVRAQEGYLFLAHPYRFWDRLSFDISVLPPDAIEVNSANMGAVDKEKVKRLLAETGCAAVTTSDAHQERMVGLYYVELQSSPASGPELAAALRQNTHYLCRAESRIREQQNEGWNLV